MNFKTIFVGGINRSGGSLTPRLFDSHSKILSYPTDLGFQDDNQYFQITDMYAGVPQSVPNFESIDDVYSALHIPKEDHIVSTEWGKEKSDPMGVRKNYLEKAFYDIVEADFDHKKFLTLFQGYSSKAKNIQELYDARHRAYFETWNNGNLFDRQTHVVMQSSGGLYLNNIDVYFKEFAGSSFIHPIRDIMGYVAAEKTRLARIYYGSRRYSKPILPYYFVKNFNGYDIEAQLRSWNTALTRAKILQEKYQKNSKFIIYRHETLTKKPEKTMRYIINEIGLNYESILTKPTIGGLNWSGNSHYGPQKGIAKNLNSNYKNVLSKHEMDYINHSSDKLVSKLYTDDIPMDLTKINHKYFFDYQRQKNMMDDKRSLTLYYGLMNCDKRKIKIKKVKLYSIFALIYSIYVRLYHIPRLFKLRYFKGKGKQNYT